MNASRGEWVGYVTKVVAFRQAAHAQWALSSKAGLLESKEFADNMSEWHRTQQDQLSYYGTGGAVLDFASPKTLSPMRTIYDIYSAAEIAKGLWDSLLINLAKRVKLETRAGTDGSAWYDDRICRIRERRQQMSAEVLSAATNGDRSTLQGARRPDDGTSFVGGLITMPLKAKERSMQKAAQNYSDAANGLPITYVSDIVRSSIVCTSEMQVFAVVKALYTTANVKVIEVKNRFKRPLPNGYRDILIRAYVSFVDEGEDEDEGSGESGESKSGLALGFICELQVHHIDLYLVAADKDAYSTYTYFRSYFGSTADATTEALKLKVLKKMDQIANDASQLEDFVENFLSGDGRASKDHVRLGTFFELFRMTGEFALAERLGLRVVMLLRARPLLLSLLPHKLSELSMLFRQQGRYREALPVCEEALAVSREVYGEEHVCTAHLISLLADIYACQKSFDKSLPLLMQSSAIRLRCCGEGHPSYIAALKLLAENYEEQRDWLNARETYKRLLPLVVGLSGENSPEVIHLLTCLGNIEELVGEFPLALQYFSDALDMCCVFFGPEHPTVATGTTLVANTHASMGATARALELHVSALNIRIGALGLEHNCTADSYLNVASILFDLGKISKAMYFAEESLRIRKLLLTNPLSDHQLYLADSMGLLGEILYNSIDYLAHHHDFVTEGDDDSQSEYDEQAVIYRAVMSILDRSKKLLDGAYIIKARIHGVDHISVRLIMHHQTILVDLLRFKRLEHEHRREHSGSQNSVSRSPGSGGAAAPPAGVQEVAIESKVGSESVVDDGESVVDDGESTIATAQSHLSLLSIRGDAAPDDSPARAVESKNEANLAAKMLVSDGKRGAVVARKAAERLPSKSARDMESATNLDATLQRCHELLQEMADRRDNSEYETAHRNHYELTAHQLLSARSYSASHAVSAILLSHLGCWCEDQRLYDRAGMVFNDVLRIMHGVYGTDIDHQHIAHSLFNYASALKGQLRFAEALSYFERARDMFRRLDMVAQENKFRCHYYERDTTAQRFDVLDLLCTEPIDECYSIEACSAEHSMAQCLTGLGRYEDSYYHISKAYSSRLHLLGEHHPDTSSSLNSLGVVATALGRVQEGLDAFDKCLVTRDKIVGQKHQAYGTISANVALSNYLFNDMAKAGRSIGVAYDIAFPMLVSGDFITLLKNLIALFEIQGDAMIRDQLDKAVCILSTQLNNVYL